MTRRPGQPGIVRFKSCLDETLALNRDRCNLTALKKKARAMSPGLHGGVADAAIRSPFRPTAAATPPASGRFLLGSSATIASV